MANPLPFAPSPVQPVIAPREQHAMRRVIPVAPAANDALTRELPGAVPLTTLARGATGRVAGVRLPAAHDAALERMALRLMEIGFVEGEHLRVVAFGQPGDDPIGVRIGGRGGVSSFALRRVEAACVWVVPEAPAGV